MQRTFEALNHSAIEFYGRAIDQFGAPVVGAEVRGTVLVNTGTHGGEMKVQTMTDDQGDFQFIGLKGQDLGIGISKDGYEYHPRNTSFSYSYFEADHKRHIPDPRNPVVFPLWKKQGAERLIHYSTGMDIPADGSPVRIDLATGKVGGEQADFVITLKRTPLAMPSVTTGYAWTASIEVVGGGMIRAGERDYYNVAPETGYSPRFEYTQNAVDFAKLGAVKAEWRSLQKEDVFLTSAGGKRFARVRIALYSYGRDTNDTIAGAEFTVWLNPNGSRNLEFDPKKAITPKP